MRSLILFLTSVLVLAGSAPGVGAETASGPPLTSATQASSTDTKIVWAYTPFGGPSEDWEIYIANADGSGVSALTDNEVDDQMPALSPDGSKIAFTRALAAGGTDMFVMGSDGSNVTRLTETPSMIEARPAWSPDGERLAYTLDDQAACGVSVRVMDADGSVDHEIVANAQESNPCGGTTPTWSPDGTEVAFVNVALSSYEIFAIKSNGTGLRQITLDSSGFYFDLDWSPTGAAFVFWSGSGNPYSVYTVGADGSITDGATVRTGVTDQIDRSFFDPVWSPAGDQILMLGDDDELYSIDAGGSGLTKLTTAGPDNASPDWGVAGSAQGCAGPCPLVVDSTADGHDRSPGDDACETRKGQCTLRAAIDEANAKPDKSEITFDLPGSAPFVIAPGDPYPILSEPLNIQATEPIEISGTDAGNGADGLRLKGGDSLIFGLTVNNFSGSGLVVASKGNTLSELHLGTDSGGTVGKANGVGLEIKSQNTTVDSSIISGNNLWGVRLHGEGATGLELDGNIVGTNAAGDAAIPNGKAGIAGLSLDGGDIGDPDHFNEIAGNTGPGILLRHSRRVHLQQLTIGLSSDTDTALPNQGGILIDDSANNRIGLLKGNVVAGNTGYQIRIQGDSPENRLYANFIGVSDLGTGISREATGIVVDAPETSIGGASSESANHIGGTRTGILIQDGATFTDITGNEIGTDLGSNSTGIRILGGESTTIGGTYPGTANSISGNSVYGILMRGGTDTTVIGNYIGNPNGTYADPNRVGIAIHNTKGVRIGGPTALETNVISGNTGEGIRLGSATDIRIQGNYIGTNADATAAIPNGVGIEVVDSKDVVIGGSEDNVGNVISGNTGNGIQALDDIGLRIAQNYIGTNLTGTQPLGNDNGIELVHSSSAVIGGPKGDGNLISGNRSSGIVLDGRTNFTKISANRIGTGPDNEADLGNEGVGIEIRNAHLTRIGLASAPNTIAHNEAGVYVLKGDENFIRFNSIFDNTHLGIDIDPQGVTGNDIGDSDTGPNGLLNFPELSFNDNRWLITMSGKGKTHYEVDIYSVPSCNDSGHGEGKKFLKTRDVDTVDGFALVGVYLGTLAPGTVLTATATSEEEGTSEFSTCTTIP